MDRHLYTDIHVCPDGYPELAGFYHVELRHQVTQTPGLAAGIHDRFRGRVFTVAKAKLEIVRRVQCLLVAEVVESMNVDGGHVAVISWKSRP